MNKAESYVSPTVSHQRPDPTELTGVLVHSSSIRVLKIDRPMTIPVESLFRVGQPEESCRNTTRFDRFSKKFVELPNADLGQRWASRHVVEEIEVNCCINRLLLLIEKSILVSWRGRICIGRRRDPLAD
jgi:hypothetical protein